MKIDGEDGIVFSSGRTRYAHNAVIGIGPELDSVSEGYDGGVWSERDKQNTHDYDYLSPEDLTELADHMIERWQAFKAKHGVKA